MITGCGKSKVDQLIMGNNNENNLERDAVAIKLKNDTIFGKRIMKLRHANIDDIPELLPLLSQLGYPCALKELKVRFVNFLNNPGYGVVICEMGNKIVGLVAWSKSDLFVSDVVRFHIEGLIVAENYRGMRIGKKLMGFVEEIAEKHAPAIIDLTSGIRRAKDGSHEFYKRLGYQNEGHMAKLYLRKEL